MAFLQQLVNGLTQGAIYALIALGYTLVYGVLRLINFAHGDIYMLGAYAGFFAAGAMGLTARLASASPTQLQSAGLISPPEFAIVIVCAMLACALAVRSSSGSPIAPCATRLA
jgi:branched-chain amino acid transport system permease protein